MLTGLQRCLHVRTLGSPVQRGAVDLQEFSKLSYPGVSFLRGERGRARRHWRELAAKLGGADHAGRQLGKLLQGIGELLASEDAAQQARYPHVMLVTSSRTFISLTSCKLVSKGTTILEASVSLKWPAQQEHGKIVEYACGGMYTEGLRHTVPVLGRWTRCSLTLAQR